MIEGNYKYSKFQKIVQFGFLIIFSICGLGLLLMASLGLISTIIDATIENVAPMLFMFGAAFCFVSFGLFINMSTPDIYVRGHGLRLVTLIYKSQWIPWDDIRFIEKIKYLQGGAYYAISIDAISPIYSIIGWTFMLGGRRSFLLWSKIDKFDELMRILEGNRPDLFSRE